ncbi:MAG: hypothetical protein PHU71_01160 [Candidatus Gracilibacteria bacterium]|nr:hypothetical protein [Candidatus Gracilibacteria bacterium]
MSKMINSLKNRHKEHLEEKAKICLLVNGKKECNQNCLICYLGNIGKRDPENAFKTAQNFLRQGYMVSIGGSEPILDTDYLKAYELVEQKYILTNGIALQQRPALYEILLNHGINELQLSMDFDGIKGSVGITSDILEKVIKKAKEYNFWVRIACIISPDNYLQVGRACEKAYNMGADAVYLIREMISAEEVQQRTKRFSQELRQNFFRVVDSTRKIYDKDKLEIRVHGNFGPKEGSAGELLSQTNQYCRAGKKLFIVTPDDKVYPCNYLLQHPIGELIDGKLVISKELCDGNRKACCVDLLNK